MKDFVIHTFSVLNNNRFPLFPTSQPLSGSRKAEAAIHIVSYAQLTRIASTVLRQAKRNGLLSDSGNIGNVAVEFKGSIIMNYNIGKERW